MKSALINSRAMSAWSSARSISFRQSSPARMRSGVHTSTSANRRSPSRWTTRRCFSAVSAALKLINRRSGRASGGGTAGKCRPSLARRATPGLALFFGDFPGRVPGRVGWSRRRRRAARRTGEPSDPPAPQPGGPPRIPARPYRYAGRSSTDATDGPRARPEVRGARSRVHLPGPLSSGRGRAVQEPACRSGRSPVSLAGGSVGTPPRSGGPVAGPAVPLPDCPVTLPDPESARRTGPPVSGTARPGSGILTPISCTAGPGNGTEAPVCCTARPGSGILTPISCTGGPGAGPRRPSAVPHDPGAGACHLSSVPRHPGAGP